MIMMFLSDKDCMDVLKLIDRYSTPPEEAKTEDDFDDEYVYTGKYNDLAFDSEEAENRYLSDDHSDKVQVSFFDGDGVQLSFYDTGDEK